MFPTSIEGTLEIAVRKGDEVEVALSNLENDLSLAKAEQIKRNGSQITFTAGMFRFVSNWNILAPINWGRIEILPGPPTIVRYYFSCVTMLWFCSIFAGICGVLFIGGYPTQVFAYLVPVGMWLWLFGMNYLVASFRLHWFVKDAVNA